MNERRAVPCRHVQPCVHDVCVFPACHRHRCTCDTCPRNAILPGTHRRPEADAAQGMRCAVVQWWLGEDPSSSTLHCNTDSSSWLLRTRSLQGGWVEESKRRPGCHRLAVQGAPKATQSAAWPLEGTSGTAWVAPAPAPNPAAAPAASYISAASHCTTSVPTRPRAPLCPLLLTPGLKTTP